MVLLLRKGFRKLKDSILPGAINSAKYDDTPGPLTAKHLHEEIDAALQGENVSPMAMDEDTDHDCAVETASSETALSDEQGAVTVEQEVATAAVVQEAPVAAA